jgi:hypothetical protein
LPWRELKKIHHRDTEKQAGSGSVSLASLCLCGEPFLRRFGRAGFSVFRTGTAFFESRNQKTFVRLGAVEISESPKRMKESGSCRAAMSGIGLGFACSEMPLSL